MTDDGGMARPVAMDLAVLRQEVSSALTETGPMPTADPELLRFGEDRLRSWAPTVAVGGSQYILTGVGWTHFTLDGGEHPVHVWTSVVSSARPSVLCNGLVSWLQDHTRQFGHSREMAPADIETVLATRPEAIRWAEAASIGIQRPVTTLLATLAADRDAFVNISTRWVREGITSQPAVTALDQTRDSYRVLTIARYLTAAFATMTTQQRATFHTLAAEMPVVQAADVALAIEESAASTATVVTADGHPQRPLPRR
jgi:hypothetical protein